ncbi:MAG: nitroreductase/quinone reductase family protein [Actinomycetota bacterium]|nr:nitroreductase/quinone reductase family protein [Actinomycetota bacterium]
MGRPPRWWAAALSVHRNLDRWLSPLAVWAVRRSRGRVARPWRVDVLVLTTTGRRSGRPRSVVLQFWPDGEAMVVVAANGGSATHPAWYFNVVAEPRAQVEVCGRQLAVRAEPVTGERAADLWRRVVDRAPGYAAYARATSRSIPVVRLVPENGAASAEHPSDLPVSAVSAPGAGTADEPAARRRPATATAVIVALAFIGATAVGGGAEMLFNPRGNSYLKAQWLDHVPLVSDWRVPGLVLGLGIGAGSLLAAWGVRRRPHPPGVTWLERATGRHWSWAATGLAGIALAGWIALEVVLIPDRSVLEVLYAVLAAALVLSCAHPSFRRYLEAAPPTPRPQPHPDDRDDR